jgi:anti-sigma factor RsiW
MSDVHKLTGAYALDAVDDIERARFEQHLAECDDCRAEVAELRETAALLAETTAVTPPASLRDSVLAGISQVRPLPPVIDVQRRRAARFRLLVAASVVAILGVAAAATQPWQQDTQTQTVTAAEKIISAPDSERVVVDLGESGSAEVIRSKSLHQALIRTEGMAAAPAGHVYQLWLQQRGEMIPAGLMEGGTQEIVLEGDAATASAAGVTIELSGGAEKPNLPPVALFDFSEAT